MVKGFGDEEIDSDDDEEQVEFMNEHFGSHYSNHIVVQREDSFDENMNDISCGSATDFDDVPSILPPPTPFQEQNGAESQHQIDAERSISKVAPPENPIALLKAPLPAAVVNLRKSGRRRRSSVFKDEIKAIGDGIMKKRISK